MSRLAPFVDAASSIDRTAWPNLFISYYTYGSAIAMGLDLSLRDRSDGKLTIDTYMRALWRRFGRIVEPDARRGAGDLHDSRSGEARWARSPATRRLPKEFFERYVEGRELVDYAKLLAARRA